VRHQAGQRQPERSGKEAAALINYLSFAQINDNELRPEQGEQPRG